MPGFNCLFLSDLFFEEWKMGEVDSTVVYSNSYLRAKKHVCHLTM